MLFIIMVCLIVGLAPVAVESHGNVSVVDADEVLRVNSMIRGRVQARTRRGIQGGRRRAQGSSMAGLVETLGSPWIPLAIRA
jgi:hypothetical protein